MKTMLIFMLSVVLSACAPQELSAVAVKSTLKECINGVVYYASPSSHGYYTLTPAFKTDSTVHTCN